MMNTTQKTIFDMAYGTRFNGSDAETEKRDARTVAGSVIEVRVARANRPCYDGYSTPTQTWKKDGKRIAYRALREWAAGVAG